MNHQKSLRKLGRNPSHRRALLRNLATSLVLHNRIETTISKAKELKRVADKLVTLGKKNTLHARRQALSYLQAINKSETGNAGKTTAVHKLFTEIAPRFSERNGGYTRVLRVRRRDGDNAEMAIIEFVEAEVVSKTPAKKQRKTKRAVEASPAKVEESKAEDAVAEEAPVEAETSSEEKAEETKE